MCLLRGTDWVFIYIIQVNFSLYNVRMSGIWWNCRDSSVSTVTGYWLVSSVNAVTVYWLWLDGQCSIIRRFRLLSPPRGEELQSADGSVPRALHSETKRPQRQFGCLVTYRYCCTCLHYMMIKVWNQLYFLICRRFLVISVNRIWQQSKNLSWFVPSSWVLGSKFLP